MNQKKPTRALLEERLLQAKIALARNKIYFAPDAPGLVEEFTALDIGDSEEIRALLIELFKEINADHYVKSRTLSSARGPKYPEFFNFTWQSALLRKKMTIEFAIDEDSFCYFSLALVKDRD